MKTMIMVGGGKGRVGKSTVAMALLDALRQDGHEAVYVETDDSNPDVHKAVNGTVPCEICSLDTESGYVRLGDLAGGLPYGDGEFDLGRLIGLLSDKGVAVPLSMEVISTRLDEQPPALAVRHVVDATRALLDDIRSQG